VHGDLKPKNVLLTRLGPVLIDDFGLESGDRAPGWTPNWSAPEQIMSEPTTPAADTYPLGVMVARLLGGIPVGEVRKFRTPPTPSGTDEHNVFFNPSVYIDRDEETDIVDGDIAKWLSFAKGCLRFDPIERPASASEFADSLQSLLEKHPLKGQLRVSILQSDLVAATLLDGSQSVSRLISDIQTDGDWELGAIPIPLDLYPKPPVPRELPHPGVT